MMQRLVKIADGADQGTAILRRNLRLARIGGAVLNRLPRAWFGRPSTFSSLVWVLALIVGRHHLSSAAESRVDFGRQILPILSTNCFACHGPDEKHREASLRLDQEAAAKEKAIVPGKPDASELIQRLTSSDDDERMPPAKTGKSLTPEQVELLKAWIEQGANWAQHWAFLPPVSPPVPSVSDAAWPHNDIDRFVLARLDREPLPPAPPASRAAWLRRVSFALNGLPPSPAEMDAFEHDPAANAYETVVDRVLRSPHYGERLAIDWLDLARYADTNGYQNDFNRSMWPWRDWVIDAYNQNLPADQFVIEQLAGDLLPNPTTQQLTATGFNRNNRTVTEAGSIDEEWRVENVVDRVETTSTAFLGLTMGCARCHDHKYDPLSRRDFYQFFAFFNNVDEQGVYTETRGNVAPLLSVPTVEEQQRLAEFDRQIAALQQQLDAAPSDLTPLFDQAAAACATPVELPALALQLIARGRQILPEPTQVAATGPERQWEPSPVGDALTFSGEASGVVDAGQSFVASSEQAVSWSLWARVDRPGALLSKMDDQQAYRGFDTIVLDDDRLKVHLIDTWPDNALAVTSEQPLPRNAWFQLVVVYDGSKSAAGIRAWLDGRPLSLKVEQDSLQGTLQTDQPLRLGSRSTGLAFTGGLADVQWYRVALTAEQLERRRLQALVAGLPPNPADRANLPERVREYWQRQQTGERQAKLQALRTERDTFEKSMQTVMVMRDRAEYRPTYILNRGQYDAPDTTEALWPQVPTLFGSLPSDAPRNRLALARWLVDPNHPLLARVMVNRVWQRMFGVGLVATPDNFGVQGELPSHPELLDWLALKFVQSGWDLKQLHKLIALSAVYQQSAIVSPELMTRDPKNRLLARGPRFRLSAEAIRDNALSVSGLLTDRQGGPSVKPYQPPGLWDELAGGASGGPYVVSSGPDLYRRSLYTFRKRTVSHPTLATFDAPSWEICQAKRGQTNTPLQALALLNDTTYVEAARHLAQRIIAEGGATREEQLRYGFRLVASHQPSAEELAMLQAGFDKYFAFFNSHAEQAVEFLSTGVDNLSATEKTPERAAWAATAAVLLNLDATITN